MKSQVTWDAKFSKVSAAVRVDLTAARYGRRVFDYIFPSVKGSVPVNRAALTIEYYYNYTIKSDNPLKVTD